MLGLDVSERTALDAECAKRSGTGETMDGIP